MRPKKNRSPAPVCRVSGESPSQLAVRIRLEIAACRGRADQSCVRQKRLLLECADSYRSNLDLRSCVAGPNRRFACSIEDRQSDFALRWPHGCTIPPLATDHTKSTLLRRLRRTPSRNRQFGLSLLSNTARELFEPAHWLAQFDQRADSLSRH